MAQQKDELGSSGFAFIYVYGFSNCVNMASGTLNPTIIASLEIDFLVKIAVKYTFNVSCVFYNVRVLCHGNITTSRGCANN